MKLPKSQTKALTELWPVTQKCICLPSRQSQSDPPGRRAGHLEQLLHGRVRGRLRELLLQPVHEEGVVADLPQLHAHVRHALRDLTKHEKRVSSRLVQ